jgi:hypothetical protein
MMKEATCKPTGDVHENDIRVVVGGKKNWLRIASNCNARY